MLFKIHSVHPNGFGTLDGNGKGEASSVTEYILNSGYFRRDLVLPKLNDRPDDQALVLHVYEILEKEAANYSPVSPSLVHNDYSPEHVFVDEGEVSGIIDMENSCGLAPIFDLARWDSKFGAKFPLKYLIEGYGDQELFKGDFERELNYWKMFNHIKSLRYNLDKSNQAGIDKCLNGLRELMPQFE
jgi:Ser/Thr protein kinase RdoA (MazF antagonist)